MRIQGFPHRSARRGGHNRLGCPGDAQGLFGAIFRKSHSSKMAMSAGGHAPKRAIGWKTMPCFRDPLSDVAVLLVRLIGHTYVKPPSARAFRGGIP